MKKLFAWIGSVWLTAAAGLAATSPLYINNAPVIGLPPQIDATAFLNRSSFDVSSTFPFQAQHVLFWTNNGVMTGNPGFIFEYDRAAVELTGKRRNKPRANSRNLNRSSGAFVNDGTISVGTFSSTTIFGLTTPIPLLSINASNVFSRGKLSATETATITVLATNGSADVSRGGIRVGPDLTGTLQTCDTTPFGSNYFLDTKITELYWGAGVNNDLGTNGRPLNLPSLLVSNIFGFGQNFTLPQPSTPSHQVVSRSTFTSTSRRFLLTNFVSLPGGSIFFGGGCSGNYDAYVYTNVDFLNPTGMTVNVVFVPTNSLITLSNLFIDVRFDTFNSGTYGNVPAAVIEFRSVDFDIVEDRLTTNYVTLVDTTGSETNVFLARPFTTFRSSGNSVAAATQRPSTYNFFTGRYCTFDSLPSANTLYSQSIFYNPDFETNIVSTIYAAYSAQVGQSNSAAFSGSTTVNSSGLRQLGVDPGLSDPTNFNGRVEISAGKLNLNNTRIRAENFIGIKALDLVSNSLANIDAPFINLDVSSSQANLILSNIAPASVSRLLGKVSAWSSAWTVNVTNVTGGVTNLNSIRYHVTLVDNCLQSQQPVTLHRFVAKSTNVVIQDNLFVNASFDIRATSLTVGPQGSINLPVGTTLAFTNVQHLLNFTNLGSLTTPGAAYFGTYDAGHTGTTPPPRNRKRRKKQAPQPPTPLDYFVNEGTISGDSLFVRATNAANSGTAFFPATMTAVGGVVSVAANSIDVSDGRFIATSDVELRGNDVRLENTMFGAGTTNNGLNQYVRGAVILDATNSMGDFESVSSNLWLVTAGVSMSVQPASMGDFLGTHIYSTAGSFVESPITWAGMDRGPVTAGFANNLALGRLTLDGAFGTLFRFGSATTNNALYVDYLELLNAATNYNFALGVDPGFTIYFGDANIPPEKLDSIGGGRIRWVRDYAGPQSGTNITYPNGVTYRFNAGMVRSKDLDSDGDGIVNADDCTPIIPPGEEANPALWFGANCPGSALAAAKAVTSDNVALTVALAAGGKEVVLNWNAPANSANTVEFTEAIAGGAWQPLTNFITGPADARVTVKDSVDVPLRVYRVRVEAGKP